jgi:5-methylcytosine-specific restriction endonuclease McrA
MSDIPNETRGRVLERDQYSCRRCGAANDLQLHHIVYRSRLGGHEDTNLVTVCFSCHELLTRNLIKVKLINGVFYFTRLNNERA